MIIVAGQMTFEPEDLGDFAIDVAAMRHDVLKEAGCQHYSLLIEDAPAGLVNVFEIWDDDEALRLHLTQPWIAAFFAKYGGRMKASTVQIYDVAGARPLPGM